MSGVRVLIVDDARLAREELRHLLAAHPQVQIVAEADDVPAARALIAGLQPDLVLLDIQLPSGSGFDVLDGLAPAPAVVFTTAYDQYAVQAFAANALDYLLKPVQPAQLARALERVQAARGGAAAVHAMPVAEERLVPEARVFLREGERCCFVEVRRIARVVVDGNYARVWFDGQSLLLARSLSALEARLPEALFFRANRSTLVNLTQVRGVELGIGDGYELRLADGSTVEVSRRQARELRERLAL